jgi:hypothetical protein
MIGLRSMVLSDGPVGVRGQRWDERDPSVAPALADRAGRDLGRASCGPGTRRSSSSYRPRIWSRGVVVRCDQGEGGSHPPRPGQENTFS